MKKLSAAEENLLVDLMNGGTLKAHRDLDGNKLYKLHPLSGSLEAIGRAIIERLKKRGFIDSNKKFPAATYLLTGRGRKVAESLADSSANPLSAKNYG